MLLKEGRMNKTRQIQNSPIRVIHAVKVLKLLKSTFQY